MKKKKNSLVIIGVILLVLFVALVGARQREQAFQGALMTVDGVEVPTEEFALFLQDQKALTVNYFVQTYGAEYGADFWTTAFNQEVPLEKAKKLALEKLIRVKVEQQMAKELGLIKDSKFETIVEMMDKDKSIYGADNLDIFQKYSVYHSKLVLEAEQKHKLAQSDISEEALQVKYEEVKDTIFNAPDDLEVMVLEIEGKEGQVAEQYLQEIRQELEAGTTLSELERKYQDICMITSYIKNYGAAEGKDENMSEVNLILKEEAYELQKGEITQPMLYGNTYYLTICIDREENGVANFEEVKVIVEDIIKEEKFEAAIDTQIDQARVKIDEKVYQAIIMQ